MASQGPYSPGAGITQNLGYGESGIKWTDYSNIGLSDNLYAYAVLNSGEDPNYTEYLRAYNFGFSIPTGSTIDGIVVTIERKSSRLRTTFINDQYLYLGTDTADESSTNHAAHGDWPSTDTVATYGSSSDTWGISPTPSMVNASEFGVHLIAVATGVSVDITAYVDHMTMTVYYTEPTSWPSLTLVI